MLDFLEKSDRDHDDPQTGVTIAKRALGLSIKLDDAGLIARSKSKLSLRYLVTGEIDKAIHLGREAIGLFQILGNDQEVADSKYNVAGIYYKTDNFHLGLIYLLDCLDIYKRIGDHHNVARVQKSLGGIYEYFGDERSAISAYERSIEAARVVGDHNLESDAYNPLSGIFLNRNEIEKAEELIDKSLQMKHESGDSKGLAFTLYGKAKIYVKKGQYHQAREAYKEAIRLHREIGELQGLGMCYHKLGVMYFETGDYPEAIEALKGALNFAKHYDLVRIKSKCNQLLYQIYKNQDEYQTALTYIEAYLKEKETLIGVQTQKVIESYEAITTMDRLQKEAEMKREKAEILEKKDKAEQASKVKQDFLSTMSHEIRTPLNAVTTITTLLQETATKEQVSLLESLTFSSNNLLRIINDILDFNKLDARKLRLEVSSVNFRELMENIRRTYGGMAGEKGISLVMDIDDDIGEYYEMDETRTAQILGNLITNAIKFTDKGSVTVSIQMIESGSRRDQLEFGVIDTGIGIDDDFIDEVFDSFSQPKSHKTKKHGGSGLGLAIVKKLIELHGSNIYVDSKEGQGSHFHFRLGLVKSEAPELRADVKQRLMDMTVLLAEDNMINAMVSMKLLSKWGLKSVHAADGNEVVRMARKQTFDCILMDIHMPGLDGFEAAQYIRNTQNPNADTPIFALTADVMAGQENFSKFFNGFLLKPIEQDKLYEALSSI